MMNVDLDFWLASDCVALHRAHNTSSGATGSKAPRWLVNLSRLEMNAVNRDAVRCVPQVIATPTPQAPSGR